ncbi:hypothetical protein [Persicobacter diffluens]
MINSISLIPQMLEVLDFRIILTPTIRQKCQSLNRYDQLIKYYKDPYTGTIIGLFDEFKLPFISPVDPESDCASLPYVIEGNIFIEL